jgi:hypothetical protein
MEPPPAVKIRGMLRRIVLIACLAAGCGGARAPVVVPEPAPAAEECVLRSGEATRPDALVAAASGADTVLVSPARARTPLGLSCTGRPVPRVAASWSADSSRSAWTLLLPAASEVAARWREDPAAADALRAAGVVSAVPLDDRRLVVTFRAAQDTVPRVFAHPALAAPERSSTPVAMGLSPVSASDLRDALDDGAAVVVTADPAVLGYASSRTGLARHPLPWSRTYVLLIPGGGPLLLDIPAADSAGFRAALARDAVRVAARAAEPPFWWEGAPECYRAATAGAAPPPNVIYPGDDPVARSLAERIVAIAGPGAVAREVPHAQLATAVVRDAGRAYVIPLPRLPLLPCREIAAWPAGAAVVPLIDARHTALVREGTPPLTVDHDGGLLVRDHP